MVRRLQQPERRTEIESQRLLEKQNRLTDKLKRDLETAKRDLELSKNNEVELTRQLDEASRRIKELEEEVAKYREGGTLNLSVKKETQTGEGPNNNLWGKISPWTSRPVIYVLCIMLRALQK